MPRSNTARGAQSVPASPAPRARRDWENAPFKTSHVVWTDVAVEHLDYAQFDDAGYLIGDLYTNPPGIAARAKGGAA